MSDGIPQEHEPMPSAEDWDAHISAIPNFKYWARSIREAWVDPHTGAVLYQRDTCYGFWSLMDVSGPSGHVQFLPPDAIRIIRDGTLVYERDDNRISEAWKAYRRREIGAETRKRWRPETFGTSDEYREMQRRLKEEGLL